MPHTKTRSGPEAAVSISEVLSLPGRDPIDAERFNGHAADLTAFFVKITH